MTARASESTAHGVMQMKTMRAVPCQERVPHQAHSGYDTPGSAKLSDANPSHRDPFQAPDEVDMRFRCSPCWARRTAASWLAGPVHASQVKRWAQASQRLQPTDTHGAVLGAQLVCAVWVPRAWVGALCTTAGLDLLCRTPRVLL
jgi:hypothetical protein